MLSCMPLFHVVSPLGVRSCRPLLLVSMSRCSACGSLVAWVPPQTWWCMLKSPNRIISPSASTIASATVSHVWIRGLLLLGLYMLILVSGLLNVLSCKLTPYVLCVLKDQWLGWTSLLTMKHTLVAWFGLYARAYLLGQYVVLVLSLKHGSCIASTVWDAGEAASKIGLAVW